MALSKKAIALYNLLSIGVNGAKTLAGLFIIENQDELNKSTYSVEIDALESMNRIHKLRGINLDNWYTKFTAQKNQLQNM
ncbi:hypothetical protein [Weissella paramesenteroides]|uniref:hypothetical protein n=1 Tax=Weissella paramesenteroides TaxID=1249 RepID=UPI00223B1AEA|nr:hypothetical protein [Weissella paramesenteroides]MCT0485950.1 hypothetical protein [Weissella paramesenteroides]